MSKYRFHSRTILWLYEWATKKKLNGRLAYTDTIELDEDGYLTHRIKFVRMDEEL